MTGPSDAPFHGAAPGGRPADRTWWITAPDGVRLRAALWQADAPKGHVIFLTGRTEFIEKVSPPAAEWIARGFSVASLDWRGQGLSDRLLAEPLKGHVGRFPDFQMDLDTLLADPAVAALPGPRVMIGHSMGGLIATGALLRPEIAGTVTLGFLNGPMLGVKMNLVMRAASWLTARIGIALGKADRWPPFGDVRTPYVLTGVAPKDNVLTHDLAMWEWMGTMARTHPETSIAFPTLGWFDAGSREMARVQDGRFTVPVLCLLGAEETVVDPDAVRWVAPRLGARLVEIPGARHEGLIEEPGARARTWEAIDGFLAEHGLT